MREADTGEILTDAYPEFATREDHGARLACGETNLTVRFVAPGIVRFTYRGRRAKPVARSFAVVPGVGPAPQVRSGTTSDGRLHLADEHLIAMLDGAGRVTVTDRSGHVLLCDGPDGGYEEEASGAVAISSQSPSDERFYGLGEKNGPLERRGRRYRFWNTDAYVKPEGGYRPDTDPLYQSIPFYIGLRDGRAYGVFIDNTFEAEIDVAATERERLSFRARGGLIDRYVFAGPAMADVLARFGRLVGTMPRPPLWSLGYQQSRWGWTPQRRVVAVMDELRRRKIPADGIWLDIQYMDGYRSFTFNPETFPDPEGLMSAAHDRGFQPVVIIDPGLKADATWEVFEAARAGGHLVMTPDGEPYVGEVWPGETVFPDFSRAATREYWARLIAGLRKRGVKGIWIDMNEPANFIEGKTLPDELVADNDGAPTTLAEIHNVYGHLMAEATRAGLRQAAPDERPFVLTRAGYAGTQRSAAMWTGDAPSTYAALQSTLPMLLGIGLSGQPFAGSDVGGYSGHASPELFARWMALGSISPFFRGHYTRNVPDQEPWSFGEGVEDVCRKLISDRYRLLPYLYSLFDAAHERGAPILRPLVYEFQDDARTHHIGDEAMLGPFLLYAPVTHPGAFCRTLYLPAGAWLDHRTGARHEGPAEITVDVDLGTLPAFIRAGAIIPHGPLLQWTGEAPLDPLTLDVFPARERSAFVFYEDDGISERHARGEFRRTRYSVVEHDRGVSLAAEAPEGAFVPPPRTLLVRLRAVARAVSKVTLDGERLPEVASRTELEATGHGWWREPSDGSVWVSFRDRAPFVLEATWG